MTFTKFPVRLNLVSKIFLNAIFHIMNWVGYNLSQICQIFYFYTYLSQPDDIK